MSVTDEVDVTSRAKPDSAEHTKGSVKQALGKLTGDFRTEAEGKAQKRRARPSEPPPRRD